MVKMTNIIVSDLSFDSKDEYDIIRSNISFINLLLEEGADEELVYEDAFLSYYVDYYDSEYKNGDFSQYVYNSGWNTVINDMVAKGLAKIGATEHLAHFRKMVAVAESRPDEEMSTFLNSQYFGTNNLRDSLNDKGFYDIDEDIMLLNARWLRNHSNLRVLSIDEMFVEAERLLGKHIDRE